MNVNYTAPLQPTNLQSFFSFARMNNTEKKSMLNSSGLLLDVDLEKEQSVKLYFLDGFFVEETISHPENKVLDIIPYKHGYRLQTFAEIKQVIVPKHKF